MSRDYVTKSYPLVIDFLDYSNTRNSTIKVIYSEKDTNTAFINAQLTSNNIPINLAKYERIVVGIRKSDGYSVLTDCVILNSENGEIEIPFTKQSLSSLGVNHFDITLYKNNTELVSPKFTFRVADASVSNETISSSDEFNTLTIMISQATTLIENNKMLTTRVEGLEVKVNANELVRESNEMIRKDNENNRIKKMNENQNNFNEMMQSGNKTINDGNETILSMNTLKDEVNTLKKQTETLKSQTEVVKSETESIKDATSILKLQLEKDEDNRKISELARQENESNRVAKMTSNQNIFDNMTLEGNQIINNASNTITNMTSLKGQIEDLKTQTEKVKVDTEAIKTQTEIVKNDTISIKDATEKVKTDTIITQENVEKLKLQVEKDEVIRQSNENTRKTQESSRQQAMVDFEQRFNDLANANPIGEVTNSRIAIDGTTKTNLSERLNYDFNKKANILDIYNRTEIDELLKNFTKGSATNYPKIVLSTDWVLNSVDGVYKCTITHSLKTQNILLTAIDNSTKESILANYKIIDDNSVEVYSSSNDNTYFNIVNLNVEIQSPSATIDDTMAISTKVWSSKKTNDEIIKKISEINLNSDSIDVIDKNNIFTADNNSKKILEDILIQLNTRISEKKSDSNNVDVVDTAGNFNVDSHGKKLLEDVLVQINTKIQANSTELGTNKTTLLNNITGIRGVL